MSCLMEQTSLPFAISASPGAGSINNGSELIQASYTTPRKTIDTTHAQDSPFRAIKVPDATILLWLLLYLWLPSALTVTANRRQPSTACNKHAPTSTTTVRHYRSHHTVTAASCLQLQKIVGSWAGKHTCRL